MKRNGGVPKDALIDFDQQMFIIREERARQAKAQASKTANKRSKSSNATASGFSRQKSGSKNAAQRRRSTLVKTGSAKKDTNS